MSFCLTEKGGYLLHKHISFWGFLYKFVSFLILSRKNICKKRLKAVTFRGELRLYLPHLDNENVELSDKFFDDFIEIKFAGFSAFLPLQYSAARCFISAELRASFKVFNTHRHLVLRRLFIYKIFWWQKPVLVCGNTWELECWCPQIVDIAKVIFHISLMIISTNALQYFLVHECPSNWTRGKYYDVRLSH